MGAPVAEEADGGGIDWAIELAISEAVTAGVFRRAERTNPRSADTWASLAAPHSRRVGALLDDAMTRLDAGGVWPCSRSRK